VDDPWWRKSVIYHVYPCSFCDASGDGIGDLPGLRRHLDYLSWLGVDGVWLSPFYRSPMSDFGYDVSDHCSVDPLFGTLDDFDAVVTDAHRLGLKIIVDWVPNHTSDRHPWFLESRSSLGSAKRDWYWWRDDRPDADGGSGPPGSEGRRPNNWRSAFTGVGHHEFPPAWTWDAESGQWYLHLFLEQQPDLNWNNPAVRTDMAGVLRFWMDRGVDGFRVDAIHTLGKDPALPDLPPDLAPIPACALADDPSVHPFITYMRSVTEGRLLLGETFLPTAAQIGPYYGNPGRPELDLAFNFMPLRSRWDAGVWKRRVDESELLMKSAPEWAWPTWVLSNHDNPRHRTRYGGSEDKARAAAVLLLTLRGTAFLYAGEEIGLEDAVVPPDRQVDPGGRDGCRAPLPWDDTPSHGWAGGPEPWLPWPPEADAGRTVAEQTEDQQSTLNLYRTLIATRKRSSALQTGTFTWADTNDQALSYLRDDGSQRRLVAVNFASTPVSLRLPNGDWEVEVSSGVDGGPELAPTSLSLRADEAVILRPR
jgi:alpha-glucosidase